MLIVFYWPLLTGARHNMSVMCNVLFRLAHKSVYARNVFDIDNNIYGQLLQTVQLLVIVVVW